MAQAKKALCATRSRQGWVRYSGPLLSAVGAVMLGATAHAQTATPQDIDSLRKAIREQARELRAQAQRLNQQLRLLDAQQRQIQQLQARLPRTGGTGAAARPAQPPAGAFAQAAPAAETSGPPPGQAGGQAAPIQSPSQESVERSKNQLTLQTSPSLANTGGVLTPRGQLVVQPTFQYDYYAQNQAVVNGFTIVPGITFGNVNLNKLTQDVYTMGLRVRLGITDRLEVNAYIPYIVTNSTTTTSPETAGAAPLNVNATGHDIGDIQLGASYQINSGADGWPVFVANLQFKTITGTSPFDVPIYTTADPNGAFLQGLPKRLPTGTGFYTLTPSVTVLYPTDPGVLFLNVKGIYNIPRTVAVQNPSGGAPTSTSLAPGNGFGVAFGIGFSLNDRTSLSLGYEQDFYLAATENGQSIGGSSYRQGSFNFGLGYRLDNTQGINLGASIGVGPNSPGAEIVLQYSKRFGIY